MQETEGSRAADQARYTLSALQALLLEFGPDHFGARRQNPFLYFLVLLLSVQFERVRSVRRVWTAGPTVECVAALACSRGPRQAIEFLVTTTSHRVEAVHFGIALFYYGLLHVPLSVEENLCRLQRWPLFPRGSSALFRAAALSVPRLHCTTAVRPQAVPADLPCTLFAPPLFSFSAAPLTVPRLRCDGGVVRARPSCRLDRPMRAVFSRLRTPELRRDASVSARCSRSVGHARWRGAVTTVEGDQVSARVNLGWIVSQYVQGFVHTDPRDAMEYHFLLNRVASKQGDKSFFIAGVKELVTETREISLILGSLQPDGQRKPGYIDRFCSPDEVSDIIAAVAQHSESKGMFDDAVQLYDLAGVRSASRAVSAACAQWS